MVTAQLNLEQQKLLIKRELALKSFRYFLDFVLTEDVMGNEVPAPTGWGYIRDLANDLDSGNSFMLLKSRQLYWTWLTAAYDLYVAMIKGRNVLTLSHGQKYSVEKIRRIKYIYDRLPKELKLDLVTDNREELHFKKSGRIYAFPSTPDAGRGFTGGLVDVDEAAFHPYAQENYRAYRNTMADGGQLIIGSTANGPHGWFHSMFQSARKGTNDYAWRFFPWSARPDRTIDWYHREERAFEGFIADFRRENPSSPEEAFTSLSGLVYQTWNPEIHVASPKMPYEQCKYRVAGVDFGGSAGNRNAVVILGVTADGHVHQYDEYAPDGELSIAEIGGFLAQWNKKRALLTVECDHQTVAIQTLRKQFGLNARRAEKKREGLDMLDFLLKNNRFTMDYGCTKSQDEMFGYRWRTSLDPNTKERYQTSTPVDHHADLMDSRRYALARVWNVILASAATPTTSQLSGKPLARFAV